MNNSTVYMYVYEVPYPEDCKKPVWWTGNRRSWEKAQTFREMASFCADCWKKCPVAAADRQLIERTQRFGKHADYIICCVAESLCHRSLGYSVSGCWFSSMRAPNAKTWFYVNHDICSYVCIGIIKIEALICKVSCLAWLSQKEFDSWLPIIKAHKGHI